MPALVTHDGVVTFAELSTLAARIAGWLDEPWLSDQLNRARGAVEAVYGGSQLPAQQAAGRDRQFDRELQQVGVEQHLVPVDVALGVAVEVVRVNRGIEPGADASIGDALAKCAVSKSVSNRHTWERLHPL